MMGAMDHSEVREILEDAAIEPGGLERLMAGDTRSAAIVAGHLAGCAECTAELDRLRRSVGLISPAVRSVPPPELRERTLAYVAALGRPRGAQAGPAAAAAAAADPRGAPEPAPSPAVPGLREVAPQAGGRRIGRLPALAGLAAAVLVAITGTALVLNAGHAASIGGLSAEVEALGDVARWTLRVDGQPDVRRVALAASDGSRAAGDLVFSPSSTELVVVADRLAPASAGHEYRCWVDIDGKRTPIGKMFFGGDLAYWVGKVPAVSGLRPGAAFGVSLVDLAQPGAPGQAVLVSGS
jgi:hypothetical protein